jgi:hypothetical protein
MSSRRQGHVAGRPEARPRSHEGYPRDRRQTHGSVVLYGNLQAEIVSSVGVRLERVRFRQATLICCPPASLRRCRNH